MTVKEFKAKFPNQPMKFYLMGVEDISDYEKLDEMIPIGSGFNINGSIDVDVRFADMSDICSYCDNEENDQWGCFCSLIPQPDKKCCDKFVLNKSVLGR